MSRLSPLTLLTSSRTISVYQDFAHKSVLVERVEYNTLCPSYPQGKLEISQATVINFSPEHLLINDEILWIATRAVGYACEVVTEAHSTSRRS